MRSYRRMRNRAEVTTDLNVTAFMNLMVVLVPFLLIMAVFSRITIHELNLPGAGGEEQAEKPRLQLEVIVRADRLILGDRASGELVTLSRKEEGHDLKQLSEWLQRVKVKFPDEVGASILAEPAIQYDDLIQVMDTVRAYEVQENGERIKAELFPEIALGDAPIVAKKKGS
ncbi:MAG: biopolymer transporter ExbD [Proteobacteria bacterium]|nr:MAG: biopolymer transporter ExbD [Pseudomonadota bacterium]QKK12113.1 MAG: biopolymer transporter ExbD [Pseudomonadota bacterium]